jgi:hypothetical protein
MTLSKLLRQFLHGLGVARGQYQVCFALSQQRCELDSEATRRAGYQRPFAIHLFHTASAFPATSVKTRFSYLKSLFGF